MAEMKWDGPFKDMDPLTLQTIVQIQLEDSRELAATINGKGKQRAGTQTDAQLAIQTYIADLQHSSTYLQDRKMAQSVAMAILQDGPLIGEAFKEEQQATSDRAMAMSMDARHDRPRRADAPLPPAAAAGPAPNNGQGPTKKQKKDHKDPWQDAEVLEKVTAMYMKVPEESMPDARIENDPDVATGESSAWAAARKDSTRPMRTCLACAEEKDFFDVIRVPCNHEYCRDCLESLFTASLRDETLFPPRCDNQEISLEWVRLWISADLAKEFEAKYEELSTKNRTYCHEPTCTTFISENSYRGSVATCSKCTKTTCNNCKKPSHTGDCPDDEALRQLIETADTQQWQRCYQCMALVELEQGCYHMRCRCGGEFCYTCGERWKTCRCKQWDEDRLLRRATQLVDRNPNRRLYRPARVDHAQPATRPPSPTPGAAVPGPSTNKRRLDGTKMDPVPVHEDENSDESEWEPDWWLHDVVVQPGAGPVHERGAQIAHAVEHLRTNHACAHDNWRSRRGEFNCEECGDFCNRFVLECRQCSLQACVRCRRNRL